MLRAIGAVSLVMVLVVCWRSTAANGPAQQSVDQEEGNPVVAERRVKPIASFDDGNPFSGGVVVATHATTGQKALRIDRSYVSLEQPQDWLGYDFLKADLFTDSRKPMNLDRGDS